MALNGVRFRPSNSERCLARGQVSMVLALLFETDRRYQSSNRIEPHHHQTVMSSNPLHTVCVGQVTETEVACLVRAFCHTDAHRGDSDQLENCQPSVTYN